MGPETWEDGKLTPVNLSGYKSKFETNYQLRANFLRLSLWKNKKFVRKYFFLNLLLFLTFIELLMPKFT